MPVRKLRRWKEGEMVEQKQQSWKEEWFGEKSPLVPIAALLTAGVMLTGFGNFIKGDQAQSNRSMRGRVLMQGVTVSIMMGTLIYSGKVFGNKDEQEKKE